MKVIGGGLPNGAEISSSMFGKYTLEIPEGFFKSRKVVLNDHLIAVEHITEENKYSILGKAGWGTLGAIALGPVGLLAGLVLGGNSKELCCACKLDTGEEFLVSCEVEECQKLKSLAQKNAGKLAKNVPVIDAQIEEKEDVMATLERLGKLRDDGVVTEDEFQQKKAELMSRL